MNKKSSLTISTSFDDHFSRRLAAIEKQKKADAQIIEKRTADIKNINAEIETRSKVLERQRREYSQLLDKLEAGTQSRIKVNAALQVELESGQITMQEHAERFCSESEIRAEERAKFLKEMKSTFAAIRKLDLELNQLVRSAWQAKQDVIFLRSRHFETKFQLLKTAADELAVHRSPSIEAEAIRRKVIDLDPDHPQGHIFRCGSIAELELLALDSIVLEEHFEQLHRYVDKLRELGFDFKKKLIQVTYLRAPISPFATDAGFSFLSLRKESDRLGIVTSGDR